MDEYLVHQTREPLAVLASEHPDWQEAIYFNAQDPGGELSVIGGLEVLPNAGYVRAYLLTLHRGEHCAYLYAGPLGRWREELRAGTLSFSIVEPLAAWRLELADEANGIRAALDFRARCPAYGYAPIRCGEPGRLAIDQSYYSQAGVYTGSFRIGERVYSRLQGLRARRWGILTLQRLPFYHWISADLGDRCINAWCFESRDGEPLYCDGAITSEAGEVRKIVRLEHAWTRIPGCRRPNRTQLRLHAEDGEILDVECRELGSHFLGAGPARWSDADAEALAQADASALSTEQHCEIRVGAQRGFGILDIVSLSGYRRYGLEPLAL